MEGSGTRIRIKGMTCPSCVARVESALRSVAGVASATVRLAGNEAELSFEEGASLDPGAIEAALSDAGYGYRGLKDRRKGLEPGTALALGIGALLSAIYLILNARGFFNAIPEIGAGLSLGMLFGAGLLTSVHCVSMCGGIALSQSLSSIGRGGAPDRAGGIHRSFVRAAPGLLYNAGRVLGYTLVGAVVGGLGQALSFTNGTKAAISLAAGIFMVLFGLRNLGVIRLPAFARRILPEGARTRIASLRASISKGGPLAVGMLNALMPCGPLQAMQLYALGTGSVFLGALSMAAFALGTVPLMAGFAAIAGIIPKRVAPILVKAGAVMTLALGIVTFGRSAAFAGTGAPGVLGSGTPLAAEPVPNRANTAPKTASDKKEKITRDRLPPGVPVAAMGSGVQMIETVFTSNDYALFAVVAGVPVRWTIKIAASELNGCNRSIIVPAYRIKKDLRPGDNLIEFTPKASGVVSYSCWMGMIRSAFAVLDE